MKSVPLVLLVYGLCFGTLANAAVFEYSFPMDAMQNVPPRESNGTADCTATLDDASGSVSINCSFSGLTSPARAVHLHGLAPRGASTTALVTLSATPATEGVIAGSGTLSPEEVSGMKSGLTYVNLHTQDWPGGEIRGQIEPPFTINAGLNDAWFNPETNGQGIVVVALPDNQQVFLAWFTYDTERPPGDVTANLGEPGHRWLTAQGPYDGNTAVLDVYLSSGGVFDQSDPPVETDGPVGAISIIWRSCERGELSYELDSPPISGAFDIVRIAEDNVPLCESLNAELSGP